MGVIKKEMVPIIARGVNAGRSFKEIAAELSEKFNTRVYKHNVQQYTARHRDQFPLRDQAEINSLISEGMRGSPNVGGKKKKISNSSSIYSGW